MRPPNACPMPAQCPPSARPEPNAEVRCLGRPSSRRQLRSPTISALHVHTQVFNLARYQAKAKGGLHPQLEAAWKKHKQILSYKDPEVRAALRAHTCLAAPPAPACLSSLHLSGPQAQRAHQSLSAPFVLAQAVRPAFVSGTVRQKQESSMYNQWVAASEVGVGPGS